jgi:hypothetical protein
MPNWVFNNLSVEGDPKLIAEFKARASTPYTTHFKGAFIEGEEGKKSYDENVVTESVHEGEFSFMNFVSPVDVETYFSTDSVKPEGYDAMSMEERFAYSLRFQSDGWYDWNVREWGTKWDAHEAELNYETETELSYKFDTAWSPPTAFFERIVEAYPDLDFEFEWEEEQGWGGEAIGSSGVFMVTKEWSIPESHADHVELDKVESCNCAWEDEPENWFDDCPMEEL